MGRALRTLATGVALLRRWWRPLRPASLGAKLILFSTLLTFLIVSSSFLALSVEIRRNTKRLLAAALANHQRTILNLQKRSLQQLVWTSNVMTGSPTLRAAMDTYVTESIPGARPRRDLLATIQNEVEKIAGSLERDILIVTDDQGKVLAASGSLKALPEIGDDLSSRPIVRQALEPTVPIDAHNFGVLTLHGEYFQVGCVPIVLQGFVIGTLTLGDRLDQKFVQRLQESFGGEIVLAIGRHIIGSTVDMSALGASGPEALTSSGAGTTETPAVLRLKKEEYLAALMSLGSDGADNPVTLYLLHSLSGALNQSNRALVLILVSYGSLAVILAGLSAWMVSRSVLRPLESFVAFMRSVAKKGDYTQRFHRPESTLEVQTLDDAYNYLIESLLQEHTLLLDARQDLSRLDRLKESEKLAALGRLLSGAAHEINNPLTGLLGNIEILLASEEIQDELRQRLEKMQREGQRIVVLVRNLLKMSNRNRDKRVTIDVKQVLRDSVALRRHDFANAGTRIDLDLGPGTFHVSGNDSELQQVFLIIISNAFDALKEVKTEPTLTIRTVRTGNQVILTFTDNGPGMINPKHVFDPFYTTKEVGQGTGLGLSISHAIIQDHSGQITAENLARGGAQFTIFLPLAATEGSVEDGRRAARGPAPGLQNSLTASVLVVDDEPSVVDLQMEILRSLGAQPIGVGTGAQAIELLRQRDFDLIVSDLKMPGGVSGPDLFHWVEANRPAMARRFLFVTGDTMGESSRTFLKEARNRCLIKPFSIEEYVSALKETFYAVQSIS